MTPETLTQTQVGSGTWQLDEQHSSVTFSVKHMGIARMGGSFQQFDAEFDVSGSIGSLKGTAQTASVASGVAQLDGHLKAPDFFDAEQHPTITVELPEIDLSDAFEAEGTITIKGVTKPVQVTGRIGGVVEDPYGNERLGVSLRATINRHDFGVSWNADLPGGGKVVSDDVVLKAQLELIRQ